SQTRAGKWPCHLDWYWCERREPVHRNTDATGQMQKAVTLDPLNPMLGEDLGYDLIVNRRYDGAVQQFRKVTGLDPQDPVAHAYLALALEAKGCQRYAAAWMPYSSEY